MKSEYERIKHFVEYFNTLEQQGIGFGLPDLRQKAKELHLKPPRDSNG